MTLHQLKLPHRPTLFVAHGVSISHGAYKETLTLLVRCKRHVYFGHLGSVSIARLTHLLATYVALVSLSAARQVL
jgi:hypothetical protein